MNKAEILNELKNLNLNPKDYIVISGASLVVRGIIPQTPDIDLACSKDFYDALDWPKSVGSAGKRIKSYGCFEISDNFYYEGMAVDKIDGFYFMNIVDVLKIKKHRNFNLVEVMYLNKIQAHFC